jgi:hypothetical protein
LILDGEPASTDDLTYLALVNYGAYTSFRVEDGAARGLGRHLARLAGLGHRAVRRAGRGGAPA